MVIPSYLVVKGSFQGMAGLLNFALIQSPGFAQQNEKGKIHHHQHFLRHFGG